MFPGFDAHGDPQPLGIAVGDASLPGGPYLLEAVVGRGGVATVYRALSRDGDHVAVKLLRPIVDPPRAALECRALEAEDRLLARLDHPAIVRRVASGTIVGSPFIALEFLSGGSLAARMGDPTMRAPLTVADHLDGPVAALATLHRAGFVHGDVKPKNIVGPGAGQMKLVDFGNCRRIGEAFGSIAVTPGFGLPPFSRDIAVDPRHDVYSLAASTLALLGGDVAAGRPGTCPPRLNRAAWAWLQAALSPSLDERPDEVGELCDLLRRDMRPARGWRLPCAPKRGAWPGKGEAPWQA